MFENQRFWDDGTGGTWAQELDERGQQVNGEEEHVPHDADGTTTSVTCKIARRRRLPHDLAIRHAQDGRRYFRGLADVSATDPLISDLTVNLQWRLTRC